MEHIAVFSDVHADRGALMAVIAETEAYGIDRVWCLGDYCSGGPMPRQCFDLVNKHCEHVLLGNHEMFVLIKLWEKMPELKTGYVRAAAYAYHELGPERLSQLGMQSSELILPEAHLVHGAPSDPPDEFIANRRDAEREFPLMQRRIMLFGHTHRAALFSPHSEGFGGKAPPLNTPTVLPPGKVMLNPGAACDSDGARWMELEFRDDGEVVATWRQCVIGGHGGIFSITP